MMTNKATTSHSASACAVAFGGSASENRPYGIENSTIELRENTTITGTTAHPQSNNPGNGLIANLRSVLRVRDNTAITSNAFDGVQLNTGSVIDFFLGATVSVTGNTGLGLRCNGGQTFYSGNVSGVTGNTAGGNVDASGNIPGCTRF